MGRPQRTAPWCWEQGCWSWVPLGTQLLVSQGEHPGSHGRSTCTCRQRTSVLDLGMQLLSLNICLFPWTGLSPRHGGKAFLLCVYCCRKLELGEHVSGLEWLGRRNSYCLP